MIDPNNKYTKMQKEHYDHVAKFWGVKHRNPCVGSFDEHNNWKDYEYLFTDIETNDKVMLDFGCGPGRNIVKYSDRFVRIDGVDISELNLKKASKWIEYNDVEVPNLYLCNGIDLRNIQDDEYDIVMSTICLQHISVRDIRTNYFREFFRVLKSGGWFTAQMGYGDFPPKKNSIDYYENFYDAERTNGGADVRIKNSSQIRQDLEMLGFKNFKHWVRPVGPGDKHPNWIFFRAQKP